MKKKLDSPALAVVIVGILLGVLNARPATADPLPSWNDGATKQRILRFVNEVTDASSPSYVPPEERIATVDNDGTLWCEKPTYVQVFFVFKRVKALAPQHPEWKTTQPFKAVLENDMKTLGTFRLPELLKLVAATHAGMTQEAFNEEVQHFFATAKHPRWKRPFQELVYQPQLELLDYLRMNDFRVFIVTGGGRDFVRGVSEDVYGVPKHQVTGSTLQTEFKLVNNEGQLMRLPEFVQPIDDKAGKPVNIERDIGRRPILAFGNSDGDIQMLEYAESDTQPWLSLLLHHDDAKREYAYNKGTEKALKVAAERGWTIINIKHDWKTVFPFE